MTATQSTLLSTDIPPTTRAAAPTSRLSMPAVSSGTNLLELLPTLETNATASLRCQEQGRWRERHGHEIAADVRRAAEELRGWGLRPGMRVGLFGPNSYQWVVRDLALLSLRCVSVALPESAPQLLEGLVAQHEVSLCLCARSSCKAEPAPWQAWIDAPNERAPLLRDTPQSNCADPEFQTPTLVFSSGTSGHLKCLTISRAGLEHAIDSLIAAYPCTPSDSLLLFLPLSNMQQRVLLYGSLFHGLNAILASPETLLRALRDTRPTVILAPPLFYEHIHGLFLGTATWKRGLALAAARIAKHLAPPARARLLRRVFRPIYHALGGQPRLMITGMAAIRQTALEFFDAAGLPLFQAYGLTECGLVTGNRPGANRLGSVGRPFEAGSVEVAEDGEIIVKREHLLASGYSGEPNAAETFCAPGMVRTGDIGHFDDAGYLYLDGRKKELIVTRSGHKVHPELLEAVFNDCPAVDRAAVILSEDGETLTAVIALRAAAAGGAERQPLNETLERANRLTPSGIRIADYHLLSGSFRVENGLLTRNLKLDRRAVRQHVLGPQSRNTRDVP